MSKSGCKPKRKNALTPNMLNHKIFIQSETSTINDEGIPISVWTTVMTLFAFREPLRGNEFFQAAAVTSEKTVRYKIRYRLGITAAMRIVDGKKIVNGVQLDRIYKITATLDDAYGDRTETHLMALEFEGG
jgi:SPP1 family predicted phage head-tail adaptor